MFDPHTGSRPLRGVHIAGQVRSAFSMLIASFSAILDSPLQFRLFSWSKKQRTADVQDSESLMRLADLGTLTCICGAGRVFNVDGTQRHICDSCGQEIVRANPALLTAELSTAEIEDRVRRLREVSVRSAGVTLPRSLSNVDEVLAYLDLVETTRRGEQAVDTGAVAGRRAS